MQANQFLCHFIHCARDLLLYNTHAPLLVCVHEKGARAVVHNVICN